METCWNVTIKDTSPIIKYFPYADGDTQGWTGVFREGNRVVNGVAVGIGDSQHVTAGQAQAQVVFNGTAIYLNGATMGDMQYQVELDGQVTAGRQNGGLLASFTNLSAEREHTLLLRSRPQASGDWLALQSAIITVGTGLTGASIATTTKNHDDAAWSYASGYAPATNPVTNANTRQSLNAGDWAALTFSGHSVLLHGSRSTDHGRYSVTLDGRTQAFNGTSGVMINDAVLFLSSGMDSLATHVVNVTNLDSRVMDISYAEVITVQGGTAFDPASANTGSTNPPSSPNIAAIIGGAIGGLVLLLIVFVLFWLRRRRNKQQSTTEEGSTNPSPSPPPTDDSKSEMTMAAVTPVVTKTSTGPRVRFGELARPGMEELPTTGRSETPPSIRPMHSILRRQESNTSNAPLLSHIRMNQSDDQLSLASTVNSGPDISSSSLTVAPPDSQRSSPAPSILGTPVRPPRPPQGLFAIGAIPTLPEPDLSSIRSRTSNEDPFNPIPAEDAQTDTGSLYPDSTAVSPNPQEETGSTGWPNTAKPAPLRTENIPQPASEQRSVTQARKDLLVALETDQVAALSRSGTRKVGLPSNPRAGLSRENSSRY